MTIENITELRAAKKKFAATYGPRIIREGYALAIGISRVQVNDGCEGLIALLDIFNHLREA